MFLKSLKIVIYCSIIALNQSKDLLSLATSSPAISTDLLVFSDFLKSSQNLRQAIVILKSSQHIVCREGLLHLSTELPIRVFNLNHNTSESNGRHQKLYHHHKDFLKLFYVGSHRVGVFVPEMHDLDLEKRIFSISSDQGLFNNTYAWFIVANMTDHIQESIQDALGKYNFHVNADITIAVANGSGSYVLYDIYKLCRLCNGPIEISEKGFWTPEVGIQLHEKFKECFVKQRINFKKTVIRVGTALVNKPHNISNIDHLMNWSNDYQFDLMQRKSYRMFKDFEKMYNMTFEVSFAPVFGSLQQPERIWTGIFGQVAYQEVDICAVPLRITEERLAVFKYTPEFHVEDINALLRHPRRNSIRNIFFEPLTIGVWWSTLAIIILMILSLALLVHQEYKIFLLNHRKQQESSHGQDKATKETIESQTIAGERQGPKEGKRKVTGRNLLKVAKDTKEELPTNPLLESRFDFIVLVILEAIFMQGPEPNIFNLVSSRMLIVSTCIFSILLMQFYGAFIVGSLLAEEPRTITTPQALLDSNFEVGMENVSYNFDIFNKSQDPIAHRIFRERICNANDEQNNLLSLEKGVERIRNGRFAFQTGVQPLYRILMRTLSEQEYCDLQEIFISPPFVIGSIVLKNSSLHEFLAQAILKYRATGLIQYNDILWKVHQPDCSLIKTNEVEVDLEHFIPALGLIALAIAFSFFVFLIELIYYHWTERIQLQDQHQHQHHHQYQEHPLELQEEEGAFSQDQHWQGGKEINLKKSNVKRSENNLQMGIGIGPSLRMRMRRDLERQTDMELSEDELSDRF